LSRRYATQYTGLNLRFMTEKGLIRHHKNDVDRFYFTRL
jgi:hypothetical protein